MAIKPKYDRRQNEPNVTGGKLPTQCSQKRNGILVKMTLNDRLTGEEERHKRPAGEDHPQSCQFGGSASLIFHESTQNEKTVVVRFLGKPSLYNQQWQRTFNILIDGVGSERIVTSGKFLITICTDKGAENEKRVLWSFDLFNIDIADCKRGLYAVISTLRDSYNTNAIFRAKDLTMNIVDL